MCVSTVSEVKSSVIYRGTANKIQSTLYKVIAVCRVSVKICTRPEHVWYIYDIYRSTPGRICKSHFSCNFKDHRHNCQQGGFVSPLKPPHYAHQQAPSMMTQSFCYRSSCLSQRRFFQTHFTYVTPDTTDTRLSSAILLYPTMKECLKSAANTDRRVITCSAHTN